MVIVVKTSDAPAGYINVKFYKWTGRGLLLLLHTGVYLSLFFKDTFNLKTRVFVAGLDMIEIHISYLVSRQEEVMLILTMEPDREL